MRLSDIKRRTSISMVAIACERARLIIEDAYGTIARRPEPAPPRVAPLCHGFGHAPPFDVTRRDDGGAKRLRDGAPRFSGWLFQHPQTRIQILSRNLESGAATQQSEYLSAK